MNNVITKMHTALNIRKENEMLRKLRVSEGLVDFCSNDYLGFARNDKIKEAASLLNANSKEINILGSTGSRLISGNYSITEKLEKKIAAFHGSEAALIYNSGYDANVGLFSCVPQRNDVIFYDELVHASIRDGIRLSNAKSYSFKHNDCSDLERMLQKQNGNIFVAVESVYSMDGDSAPLIELVRICEKNNANLIVDEAHATGIYGAKGQGLVDELNLNNSVFAKIHTFGKALGCHGAAVCGSAILRDYLINFSRSFIYTTALPVHSLCTIEAAYEHISKTQIPKIELLSNVLSFLKMSEEKLPGKFIPSTSAIHCVVIGGNKKTAQCALQLQKKGFDVRAILSPTVPVGTERLRICLHSFNTKKEIENLFKAMTPLINDLNE